MVGGWFVRLGREGGVGIIINYRKADERLSTESFIPSFLSLLPHSKKKGVFVVVLSSSSFLLLSCSLHLRLDRLEKRDTKSTVHFYYYNVH